MKIEILFLSLLFYIIILILMLISLFWKKDFNLNFKEYFKDLAIIREQMEEKKLCYLKILLNLLKL